MTSAGHHVMLGGASAPPAPAYWGLCFTAEEPNVVVNMAKTGSVLSDVTIEASTDGVRWTAFDVDGGTTPITLASIGDHVFFRAGASGNNRLGGITTNSSNERIFSLTGKCGASGNIMSLLSASNPQYTLTSDNTFAFKGLFRNCGNLTTAPELPSTTVARNCYRAMFINCTGLTTAPSLPATTLEQSCYDNLFSGCSSLIKAPVLPATAAPPTYSYRSLFQNCSALREIETHATAWSKSGLNNWVDGVAATGTFRCLTALGTDETITRGLSNCPVGWTVVNID